MAGARGVRHGHLGRHRGVGTMEARDVRGLCGSFWMGLPSRRSAITSATSAWLRVVGAAERSGQGGAERKDPARADPRADEFLGEVAVVGEAWAKGLPGP